MQRLTTAMVPKPHRAIRVLQFGEGNFLRAFVDYMIDIANEKGITDYGIAIVKPIPFGSLERFDQQDNLYTVVLRGQQNNQVVNEARIITSVEQTLDCYHNYNRLEALACLDTLQIVVSNTTEAGIVFDGTDQFDRMPPTSYPGKLTKLLYRRFQTFSGAPDKGLIIIPCELIEHNGDQLHRCVDQLIDLWGLGEDFRHWVADSCTFCSTLVDRIVTGYPRDELERIAEHLGYEDQLVDVAEPFGLWVIESKQQDISDHFPLDKADLPVVFISDQTPYRERKVRVLNGAHTGTVLAGHLAGFETVGQLMKDDTLRRYLEKLVYEEIVPTVHLPRHEVLDFADSVFERFANPFLRHRLLDISLNSVSKWKARILPSFRDSWQATGQLPKLMTFSFAALLAFYTSDRLENGVLVGHANGQDYAIRDDAGVISFFAQHATQESTADYVQMAAARQDFWGEDLSRYPGFANAVTEYLTAIRNNGMAETLKALVE